MVTVLPRARRRTRSRRLRDTPANAHQAAPEHGSARELRGQERDAGTRDAGREEEGHLIGAQVAFHQSNGD